MSSIITLEPADYMTVAMARLIQDGERIFHGVASPMPAVAIQLAKKHHAKKAVYLSIAGTADAVPTEFSRHTTAGANLREGAVSEFLLSDIVNTSCTWRQNFPYRHSEPLRLHSGQAQAKNLYEYETLR